MQPYQELEKKWAEYCGTDYAVSVNTGTAGLTLALRALNIREGDEVIVPEFSMIAAAWAVSYNGATPIFVDCGTDLNIDVTKIEEAITENTKAIIPVHIYGRVANMEVINKIAKDYNLFVIEDACEAHGATYQGKKTGSLGDVGVFSLYRNKIIQSEEGGLITTNDKRLYEQMQDLKSMSFGSEHNYLHKKVGFNFRMTNMQATMALGELKNIEKYNQKRHQVREWYDKFFADKTLPRPDGSVVWVYDMLVDGNKNELVEYLNKQGVPARHFFRTMSEQPMYYDESFEYLLANEISRKGLYLPVHHSMTKQDVELIAAHIQNFYE